MHLGELYKVPLHSRQMQPMPGLQLGKQRVGWLSAPIGPLGWERFAGVPVQPYTAPSPSTFGDGKTPLINFIPCECVITDGSLISLLGI